MSKIIYTEIFNPNGNFLFTVDQLNQAKTHDKCLPCRCKHCNKIFYISRKQYKSLLSGCQISLQYCSLNCLKQHKKYISTQITKPCLFCGKLVTKSCSQANRYPNFFCCQSHAASYNNSHKKRQNKTNNTKNVKVCLKVNKTNKTDNTKNVKACSKVNKPNLSTPIKCNKSMKKSTSKSKRCSVCGQTPCIHTKGCKGNWLRQAKSIKRLSLMGFDVDTIGTPQVAEAYQQFKNHIIDLYINQQKSQADIAKMYNIPCSLTVSLLFKWLQIPVIDKHQQGNRSILKQKQTSRIVSSNYKYKHGYHTTWTGAREYYRSSYELDYCKYLDKHKINYSMQSLRIKYWDSVRQAYRIAIADFYLPDTNTIVEVKSKFTYNKQNMIDKSNWYKKLGYNFTLMLEHQQYDYCP